MKLLPTVALKTANRRTPRGVRGLKLPLLDGIVLVLRRTPRGVRGLKLRRAGRIRRSRMSHPARGAWIETVYNIP